MAQVQSKQPEAGSGEFISYGRRISQLAQMHPDKTAIVFATKDREERLVAWQELDSKSTKIAHMLKQMGVDHESLVVVGFPNCPEHFFAAYGAWKLGALVLPVRMNLPDNERDQILELAEPKVVIADWENIGFTQVTSKDLDNLEAFPNEPLPEIIPIPGKSVGSGGSTGRPKIIVDPRPWGGVPGILSSVKKHNGFRPDQVQLVAGALYHNSPFSWSHYGLFENHLLVVMEKFDASHVVDLIERHHVNFAFLAPTMMKRIVDLEGIDSRDFSSIQAIFHTAAPCPSWLKRRFMDLVGPSNVYESFGSAEAIGSATIRGDEWLLHPGSVGKSKDAELKILDEDGQEVGVDEVGEIFFKPRSTDGPTYYYIGSPQLPVTSDGFSSVGDMGRLDSEGYLYIADRRVDLIISGGANVYPAEVEAILTNHPQIADVVVIGLPDEAWGKRVHALIEPKDLEDPPSDSDLTEFCKKSIASYKVPKTFELVTHIPRDGAGKIRRRSLIDERST